MILISWPTLNKIYPFVFGSQYAAATIPCMLILTGKAVSMVGMIVVSGLRAIHRDRPIFWAATVAGILSISLNAILLPRFGVNAAAYIYILCELTVLTAITVEWKNSGQKQTETHN